MHRGEMEPSLNKEVCPGGGCPEWAVAREWGWVQLSKAEEPVDTHWTVMIVGAD